MASNNICRKCETCGLPIQDYLITRCPRCNAPLKPINHSCDSCASKNSCAVKFDFHNMLPGKK